MLVRSDRSCYCAILTPGFDGGTVAVGEDDGTDVNLHICVGFVIRESDYHRKKRHVSGELK